MKDNKLQKCPCCGSEASLVGYKYHWVECENELCGLGTKSCDTEDEAISIWNTRKPTEQILEKLEELKDSYVDAYAKTSSSYCRGCYGAYDDAIAIVKSELN